MSKRITKKALVDRIAQEADVVPEEARIFLESFQKVLTEALKEGYTVRIDNLGVFEVRERKPRKARNPRTGEQVSVPGRRYPHFRFSIGLKRNLN